MGNEMSEPNTNVERVFAVIAAGVIGEMTTILPFRLDDGTRTPVVLYTHKDKERCERQRKRLAVKAGKVHRILGDGMQVTQPIFGVCEIEIEAPKRKEAATEEPSPPAATTKKRSGR